MKSVVKEFKEFIARGTLIELAVAFVLGLAFVALINSFVDDLLMQVVALLFGEPNFGTLTFTLNDTVFRYGNFLNTLINFLVVGLVMFGVVKIYNQFKKTDEGSPEPSEVELLTEIRDLLRRQS